MSNFMKNLTNRDPSVPDLNRSEYSLVSCSELSPSAVELWLGLPDEVKYDPALAPFRKFYEKEHGNVNSVSSSSQRKGSLYKPPRLPLVSSAPVINNNHFLHTVSEEEAFRNSAKDNGIEITTSKDDTTMHNGLLKSLPVHITKIAKAGHFIKLTLLLAVWLFFTIIFITCNEKEHIVRQTFVAPSEDKLFTISSVNVLRSLTLKLTGPFMTEQSQQQLNEVEKRNMPKINVWYESWTDRDGYENHSVSIIQSNIWEVYLEPSDPDFSIGEKRTHRFNLNPSPTQLDSNSTYVLRVNTTSPKTTPFSFQYDENPLDLKTGVVCAFMLLIGLYILIIFEVINRCMSAVLVSLCSLAVLAMVGERPTLEELVSWLDMETLLLLFSMMLLVAIMAETGMFDYLAVYTFEKTKGKIWPLINLLCIITALLSTFLDNVTTVLLMTPVTIRLCEVMQLDPVPILMSMVIFSNIGGTATPVGDPPNVIIASNKEIISNGINFTNFTLHMTIGVLLVCVQTFLQLRYLSYRDLNKLRLSVPADIQELKQQIAIWRRAAESLPHLSKDENVVKERLERKVSKLSLQLEMRIKENTKRACPENTFNDMLADMKQKYGIKDKMLLLKSTFSITFVVILFFLHSLPELNRVSLGWTALLGAVLLLILADREDLEPVLHRVEWSTLLFFAALFVLMEALTKLGLIEYIGGLTEAVIFSVDESARLTVALLLMLWVSGITSAFVDNIPLTTMMVRIVTSLGSNPELGLPLAPLVFALSFGACLGGNGTLIGASANVVCAGVAEQHGYKITFKQFFLLGFPLMVGHLMVISLYLIVCHTLFTWSI